MTLNINLLDINEIGRGCVHFVQAMFTHNTYLPPFVNSVEDFRPTFYHFC